MGLRRETVAQFRKLAMGGGIRMFPTLENNYSIVTAFSMDESLDGYGAGYEYGHLFTGDGDLTIPRHPEILNFDGDEYGDDCDYFHDGDDSGWGNT